MPPLFPLTLALYAAACTLFFVAVAQPQLGWPSRLAMPILGIGLLNQAIDIAWLCVHGQHPGSSAREALFFAAWLMLAALPLRTYRQPLPLLGALLVPVAMVIDVVVRVLPANSNRAGEEGLLAAAAVSPTLATLHIFSATFGVALFGVSAAASVVYLLSERRLKRHRPSTAGSGWRGPSLETLDAWNQQGIVFGLLAFTAALVSGAYWMLQMPRQGASEPGLLQQARHLLSQPRWSLAVLTWLIFAGLLIGRGALGLRGRRAAQVTLLGFLTGLAVLLIYLARDVGGLRP
jgi:ABC-type uncharacterized transport system permease subunit